MRLFLERHAVCTGMAVSLLLLSILCRFMTGMRLKRLIREAGNMSATEHPALKQCRLKFQNCCELNEGKINAGVFVEKFMQNIRIGRCSLRTLYQISGQLLLLSVFADGIGACLGIICKETLGEILPFYLLAFFSLYLHFSITGLIDVQGKQEVLKTTITDFLENRMTERMRSVKQDTAYLDAEEKKIQEEAAEDMVFKETVQSLQKKAANEELEALLSEFLA